MIARLLAPSGRKIDNRKQHRDHPNRQKDNTVTDRIAPPSSFATSQTGTAIWIALIAGLTVVGSFAYACAAPLAAVAALAALRMGRAEGLALVVVSWLANQFVGFVLLSYPHTVDSYAWGAAIGVSAIFGFLAARAATQTKLSEPVALAVAFAVAFVIYQIGLYAAGVAFAYEGDAFSTSIVTEVLTINVVAYVGFLLIHRAAVALALVKPARPSAQVAA
jgi:hypothetical protein